MDLTVDATYENGVLKPTQPLPFAEHEKVRVTLETSTSWVERTAGIMGFQGPQAEADYFATDPELDYPPRPAEP